MGTHFELVWVSQMSRLSAGASRYSQMVSDNPGRNLEHWLIQQLRAGLCKPLRIQALPGMFPLLENPTPIQICLATPSCLTHHGWQNSATTVPVPAWPGFGE
jgi:hypothetical protein